MMSGKRDFRPDVRRGPGIASPLDLIEGILATPLDAASGSTGKDANNVLTGSTTATLNLIAWSDDETFYLTGKSATVRNRSDVFSAGAGTHLVAFKIGGEFRPMPIFQTVRGRLLRTLTSDDVLGWPKFGQMEVLGPGRVFGLLSATDSGESPGTFVVSGDQSHFIKVGDVISFWEIEGTWTVSDVTVSTNTTIKVEEDVIAADFVAELDATVIADATGTTVTLSGDVRPNVVNGHWLLVENSGDADGIYTIKHIHEYLIDGSTRLVLNEDVPEATLTGSSTAKLLRSLVQKTIHADPRLNYAIQSVTAGNPGEIEIDDPDAALSGTDPICACDMFLEGQRVIISGSQDGENDGTFRCVRDFTDNGSTITVYLDGEIVTSTGDLGVATLKIPPPLIVRSRAEAVLRWYRATVQSGAIIHTLPRDGDGWCEIIASDIGPSIPVEPDAP